MLNCSIIHSHAIPESRRNVQRGTESGTSAVRLQTAVRVGSGYMAVIDLDSFAPPLYWNASLFHDDVTALGWTDKQLPCAYDIDGDGGDELVRRPFP